MSPHIRTELASDTNLLNVLADAYVAGYRLQRDHFGPDDRDGTLGSCFYFTSEGREIIGTRDLSVRQTLRAAMVVLGEPLRFAECYRTTCHEPATHHVRWAGTEHEYLCAHHAELAIVDPNRHNAHIDRR